MTNQFVTPEFRVAAGGAKYPGPPSLSQELGTARSAFRGRPRIQLPRCARRCSGVTPYGASEDGRRAAS